MTRVLGIVSGKGGVGKTTTSINLALALSNKGKDVIVLDGNLTSPNIGLYLGINNPRFTIHEVLDDQCMLNNATYLHASGLKLIPGNIKLDALRKLDLNRLKKLSSNIQGISEDLIVDCGSGLTKESIAIMNMTDELIVVTNPELIAVTEAMKTIKKAEEQNKLILGVLVNRVKKNNELSIDNIKSILDYPILGVIPESEEVKYAQSIKHPVVYVKPKSIVSREFNLIAEKLK